MKMLCGVLVLRAIAAADMAAHLAETQVHPRIARLQTVFTPLCARRDLAYLGKMFTRFHWLFLSNSY
jgi:hypothetical protein